MTVALSLLFFVACHPLPSHAPTLSELSSEPDEARAGRWLMEAPPGLVRLDAPAAPHSTAIIAVHGYQSEGSEWVKPLATMGTWGQELYFYRWNWNQCPTAAAHELDAALDALVASEPSITSLLVVSHSYGGLITAMMGQREAMARPARLELIAAPLAGHPSLTKLCPGDGLSDAGPGEGVTWHQWRTVHEADGAFKDLETDPQLRELPGLKVTALPADWEGGRLGHNRSIQWVMGQLGADGEKY